MCLIESINWTALSLFVAAGAFVWQIISRNQEKAYTNSQFALGSALESYDLAIELLSDDNNDRVTWIIAARIVERANQISTNVTEQVHIDVLKVQLEKYRRQIATRLGQDDPIKNGSFFYGSKKPSEEGVDDAAKASTQRVLIGGVSTQQENCLDEGSLATLYALASYPSDYNDPLKINSFDQIIIPKLKTGFPGLYEYMSHRKEYESVYGTLKKREKKK